MKNALKVFIISIIVFLSFSIYSVIKSIYEIKPSEEQIKQALTETEAVPIEENAETIKLIKEEDEALEQAEIFTYKEPAVGIVGEKKTAEIDERPESLAAGVKKAVSEKPGGKTAAQINDIEQLEEDIAVADGEIGGVAEEIAAEPETQGSKEEEQAVLAAEEQRRDTSGTAEVVPEDEKEEETLEASQAVIVEMPSGRAGKKTVTVPVDEVINKALETSHSGTKSAVIVEEVAEETVAEPEMETQAMDVKEPAAVVVQKESRDAGEEIEIAPAEENTETKMESPQIVIAEETSLEVQGGVEPAPIFARLNISTGMERPEEAAVAAKKKAEAVTSTETSAWSADEQKDFIGEHPETAGESPVILAVDQKAKQYADASTSYIPKEALKDKARRIALFPFENLTDNGDALRDAMPVLINQLERKGIIVVDEEMLYGFLCRKRVRYSGYVSKELAQEIGDKFMVSAIMVGSIVSYSTGDNPKFGILARLIDTSDGTIIWADYSSATGEDFATVLGLGRLETIFSVIPRVIDKLLVSFDIKNDYKKTEITRRIAVMPFQNNSKYRNAGKIVTYMFLVELLKKEQFEPIEYGNIRKLIIDLRVRNRGDLDYDNLRAISEPLHVNGVLVGVVDLYSPESAESPSPRVSFSARLLDSSEGNILWYNSQNLTGEDGIIALDWGRIRSVDKVAYNVVSRFVEEMETAKFQ